MHQPSWSIHRHTLLFVLSSVSPACCSGPVCLWASGLSAVWENPSFVLALYFKALCLCRLMRKHRHMLVLLRSKRKTADLHFSVDSGCTTACGELNDLQYICVRSDSCSLYRLCWILFSNRVRVRLPTVLLLVHKRRSRFPDTKVALWWRLILMCVSSAAQARCWAENRRGLTATTLFCWPTEWWKSENDQWGVESNFISSSLFSLHCVS